MGLVSVVRTRQKSRRKSCDCKYLASITLDVPTASEMRVCPARQLLGPLGRPDLPFCVVAQSWSHRWDRIEEDCPSEMAMHPCSGLNWADDRFWPRFG